MIAQPIPETPSPATPFQPGRCADHPDVVLVDRRTAGLRTYNPGPDPAVICRSCPEDQAERCRWCGRALYAPNVETWNRREDRAYCSDRDRLRAWRARP